MFIPLDHCFHSDAIIPLISVTIGVLVFTIFSYFSGQPKLPDHTYEMFVDRLDVY